MSVILYPREVICGKCGAAMLLGWEEPFGRGSEEPVYRHSEWPCEFKGKKLKPTGLFAGEIVEEEF